MKRVAAIDLGTNTFHLLITEKDGQGFKEIFRERRWVSLAEDGIECFSEKVLNRAWIALDSFAKLIVEHRVEEIRTTGTEAFRSASNGIRFLEQIQERYNISVDVISGEREAELIYKGTSLLFPGSIIPNIIMDIGGGSTEFVIYDKNGIKWLHSYKAGVTHLYNLFVHSDPISEQDFAALRAYLQELFSSFQLQELHPQSELVGASGSFEVLESMLQKPDHIGKVNTFSLKEFYEVYKEIQYSSLNERLEHPGIPNDRAKLIVVAFTLIDEVIQLLKPSRILVSPYALKEGLVKEMLEI
jgi:exopolyphosphatase/guanosine-5'-triphosphate,3'-diphosphate pyrophosphatase